MRVCRPSLVTMVVIGLKAVYNSKSTEKGLLLITIVSRIIQSKVIMIKLLVGTHKLKD